MMNPSLLSAVSICAVTLATSMSSNAALISKLGGQVVYDSDLAITWIADANLAATNTFGLPVGEDLPPHEDGAGAVGGINSNGGTSSWGAALHWIDAMNAANYLGFNKWRLPTTAVPDASCQIGTLGFNCTGSEMGHLFYEEIGATAGTPLLTAGDPTELDKFNFTNFPDDDFQAYWSGTGEDEGSAYAFYFSGGRQVSTGALVIDPPPVYAWAVGDGNVPIPGAVWLFTSGLLGMVGIAKRKKVA